MPEKTILVTGALGQLGQEIHDRAQHYPEYVFHFTDVQDLDITDAENLDAYVQKNRITHIINCAAYTAVDKAESDQKTAEAVNARAPEILGLLSQKRGTHIYHISTDYVFDGSGNTPYAENHSTHPINVYGQTKRAGELLLQQHAQFSVIIRTAWLYSAHGANFVKTMLRLGNERDSLNVIADQIGTPTYAGDLADAVLRMIDHQRDTAETSSEIYHFSNEGVASWYDFACAIMEYSGTDCSVYPITTQEYPTPAQRPQFSLLSKTKIKTHYTLQIPHWRDSLKTCLRAME